jgi:hypothetical protein
LAELLPKLWDGSGVLARPVRKPSSIDHEPDEVLTARLIEEEDEDEGDFQPGDEEESVSEAYEDAQEDEDAFSFASPDETIDPAGEDGFQNEVIRLFETSEATETAEMAACQGGAGVRCARKQTFILLSRRILSSPRWTSLPLNGAIL